MSEAESGDAAEASNEETAQEETTLEARVDSAEQGEKQSSKTANKNYSLKSKYADSKNTKSEYTEKNSRVASQSHDHAEAYEPMERELTNDGAIALIHYTNPKTGEKEFFFEQKVSNYREPEFGSTLALIGGTMYSDESPLETLVRELKEEAPDVAGILIKNLKSNPVHYDAVTDTYKGRKYTQYVFDIEITDPMQWDAIKNSMLSDDAGYARIVKLDDAKSLKGMNWAFNHKKIFDDFVMTRIDSNGLQNYTFQTHQHSSASTMPAFMIPGQTAPLTSNYIH